MGAREEALNLVVTVEVNGDVAFVSLKGRVDEDSDLSGLLPIEQGEIVFDFDGLMGMNSCGIREWVRFIGKIPEEKKISYTNCPVQIIEQINLIMDFRREGTEIKCFYAPYYCESCDEERQCFLTPDEVTDGHVPPMRRCESCNEEMEFDYPEEQFFRFLKK